MNTPEKIADKSGQAMRPVIYLNNVRMKAKITFLGIIGGRNENEFRNVCGLMMITKAKSK